MLYVDDGRSVVSTMPIVVDSNKYCHRSGVDGGDARVGREVLLLLEAQREPKGTCELR